MKKPQYALIEEYIINNIDEGKYQENEQIESENTLCELFGVTRMTVRQAVSNLVNRNIVYSVPKVGTFVCKKSKFREFDSLTSFTEDCQRKNLKCTSVIISHTLEKPTVELAEEMDLKNGDRVWHIKRLRKIDGEPVAIEDTYCNYQITGDISEEVVKGSLYGYFENELQCQISFSDQTIDACLATGELSEYLEIEDGTPLLRTLSITRLYNGECIECGYTYYRVDKYTYSQVAYRKK